MHIIRYISQCHHAITRYLLLLGIGLSTPLFAQTSCAPITMNTFSHLATLPSTILAQLPFLKPTVVHHKEIHFGDSLQLDISPWHTGDKMIIEHSMQPSRCAVIIHHAIDSIHSIISDNAGKTFKLYILKSQNYHNGPLSYTWAVSNIQQTARVITAEQSFSPNLPININNQTLFYTLIDNRHESFLLMRRIESRDFGKSWHIVPNSYKWQRYTVKNAWQVGVPPDFPHINLSPLLAKLFCFVLPKLPKIKFDNIVRGTSTRC